jgi:hypothetical protein
MSQDAPLITPAREAGNQEWWVLAFNLPAQPAYGRVKVWRRLQDVGAVAFKNALYLLPHTDDALEDFEWILRDVREAGGDGLILDGRVVQGLSREELIRLFDDSREQQYRELAEAIATYSVQFDRKRARPTTGEAAANLARFRARLATNVAIDFFQANGRAQVEALLRELEPHAAGPVLPSEVPAVNTAGIAILKGRTWVTRSNVHVDRMASAWLVRRWIDPDARFKFVADRQYRPAAEEVRFDMYEGEFTHDSERCTFEVLVARLGGGDAALAAIAEIVHDLDLKDQKYGRDETAGIQQVLSGIVANHTNDEDRLTRASALFDDLYHSFLRRR